MLISEKIGGLPLLSWVFDHGPIWAGVIVLIADFGIICALMYAEGIPPTQRTHYKTFLWNDTIFIPLYMAMTVVILQDAPKYVGFYTSWSWHALLLAFGFATSVYLEHTAITGEERQYTISQELSPSKLWHTFIFGIVFYWILSVFIPLLMEAFLRPQMWHLLVLVAAVGFFFNSYRDATLPFPEDAHLEGSWSKWDWHRRKY
ncbi:MAG TPA: hypothetical protein VJJ20_01645 [Candidatus Paceibacterota bacterium]